MSAVKCQATRCTRSSAPFNVSVLCCAVLFCAVLCCAACVVQAGHKHGVGKYTWNSGASYQGESWQLHIAIVLHVQATLAKTG
jgi:hypothetical protein